MFFSERRNRYSQERREEDTYQEWPARTTNQEMNAWITQVNGRSHLEVERWFCRQNPIEWMDGWHCRTADLLGRSLHLFFQFQVQIADTNVGELEAWGFGEVRNKYDYCRIYTDSSKTPNKLVWNSCVSLESSFIFPRIHMHICITLRRKT